MNSKEGKKKKKIAREESTEQGIHNRENQQTKSSLFEKIYKLDKTFS
jgi:hypothetical protein